MAKKQSFADKMKKSGEHIKVYKIVMPYLSKTSGTWKFSEKYVKIDDETDETKFLNDQIKADLVELQG